MKIRYIYGSEILDSRGNPTIQVELGTDNCDAIAKVPSGKSTGQKEAVELRDDDKKRYHGKGVLKAVKNVNEIINKEIIKNDFFADEQNEIDQFLIELDGTNNKAKLGANAILGVSMASARCAAKEYGMPLYKYLGGVSANCLPIPMLNIINGGEHADNSIDFQEFMIVPLGAKSFKEAIRWSSETFHELEKILKSKNEPTTLGDEGGFAPNITTNQAIELISQAITNCNYKLGKNGIAIAIDCAANSFYDEKEKLYKFHDETNLNSEKKISRTSKELVAYLGELINKYPQIISIEDPFYEKDDAGFKEFTKLYGHKIQIVGDDIFVTNPKITKKGIEQKLANSVLIKVNQIGTVSETIQTINLAKNNNWTTVISHRSGETTDTFIADLAVGFNSVYIKSGSMSRSERVVKYNRLMEIEDELGDSATYQGIAMVKKLNKNA